MASAAGEEMGHQNRQVLADRRYFNGPEIKAEGRFDKSDFIYISQDDEYQCPAGERAIHRFATVEKGLDLNVYWPSACPKVSTQTTVHDQQLSTYPPMRT
jgi:hypothetical protein